MDLRPRLEAEAGVPSRASAQGTFPGPFLGQITGRTARSKETQMTRHAWVQEFAAAITVSDAQGKIIEMNAKAAQTFEKDGGTKLSGTNVLDCHPEPARSKLRSISTHGNLTISLYK